MCIICIDHTSSPPDLTATHATLLCMSCLPAIMLLNFDAWIIVAVSHYNMHGQDLGA